ncbi:flagellar basal body rod protein FlgB [Brockia lithotrophica]|uniref:Flagellar basal body rod protein FlgB n=1 Tax=Brockia lithotrophica TaxID=933949 RepID=A0A660KTT8_9BACL|nr:flagellar basal body rod protein FlgB [Brockia lithotrophica]RKQ84186.1 flagellar basal-body rod protein FlgB [Brockia lithotrophica]
MGVSPVTDALHRAVRVSFAVRDVAAHNLANADTPGYKRFAAVLAEVDRGAEGKGSWEARRTDVRHFPFFAEKSGEAPPVRVVRDETTSARLNGNNVDVDAELVRLMDEQLRAYTLLGLLGQTYARYRDALRGS